MKTQFGYWVILMNEDSKAYKERGREEAAYALTEKKKRQNTGDIEREIITHKEMW